MCFSKLDLNLRERKEVIMAIMKGLFSQVGLEKVTVDAKGLAGKVQGVVLEKDLMGRPMLVKEDFTGREYRRTISGTYEPVSGGGLFSPKK